MTCFEPAYRRMRFYECHRHRKPRQGGLDRLGTKLAAQTVTKESGEAFRRRFEKYGF